MEITVLRRFKDSIFVKFKPTDEHWYIENISPEFMHISHECKGVRHNGLRLNVGTKYTNNCIMTMYVRACRKGVLRFSWAERDGMGNIMCIDLGEGRKLTKR